MFKLYTSSGWRRKSQGTPLLVVAACLCSGPGPVMLGWLCFLCASLSFLLRSLPIPSIPLPAKQFGASYMHDDEISSAVRRYWLRTQPLNDVSFCELSARSQVTARRQRLNKARTCFLSLAGIILQKTYPAHAWLSRWSESHGSMHVVHVRTAVPFWYTT
jgi:hypothetical protein